MSATQAPPRTWTHPLQDGIAPPWASEWGVDRQFGPFCILRVGDATQRLRWIPPGNFWMGSPEEEEGRFPGEGPRHVVRIEPGFWIFDTPCTQGLWAAVMGSNPSHFQEEGRPESTASCPVERVSWEDCQEFLRKLNERHPGLSLSLPSESQWEYACRGGAAESRYSEDVGAIAWYVENSGGRTHPVATKESNAWGLYDMLGNVYEWCSDTWRSNYRASPDGSASAHRVLRGGSWSGGVRYLRAASRIHVGPSRRGNYLGFRCAQFRERS